MFKSFKIYSHDDKSFPHSKEYDKRKISTEHESLNSYKDPSNHEVSLRISPISKNTNYSVYHHEASLIEYHLVVHYSVNNSLSRTIVDHHPSIQ